MKKRTQSQKRVKTEPTKDDSPSPTKYYPNHDYVRYRASRSVFGKASVKRLPYIDDRAKRSPGLIYNTG